ncbi:FAD-binding protein [Oerskovia sp. M15]
MTATSPRSASTTEAVAESGAPGNREVLARPTLAELTTLRVGGPADAYVETSSEAELIDAVRAADDAGEPLLVLGSGSNLLVSDEGSAGSWCGTCARAFVSTPRTPVVGSLTAPAGQDWDQLVAQSVDLEWVGVEALSGIPARSGRRRSRTSVPTARRSPESSPRCACGTASSRASARSRWSIWASATAPRCSSGPCTRRPTAATSGTRPRATSCWT